MPNHTLMNQLNQLSFVELTQLYQQVNDVNAAMNGNDNLMKKAIYANLNRELQKQENLDNLIIFYLQQARAEEKSDKRTASLQQQSQSHFIRSMGLPENSAAQAQLKMKELIEALHRYDNDMAHIYTSLHQTLLSQLDLQNRLDGADDEIEDENTQAITADSFNPALDNKLSKLAPKFDEAVYQETDQESTTPKPKPRLAKSRKSTEELAEIAKWQQDYEKKEQEAMRYVRNLSSKIAERNLLYSKINGLSNTHKITITEKIEPEPKTLMRKLFDLFNEPKKRQESPKENLEALIKALLESKKTEIKNSFQRAK